jgi:hypothetical protein
MANHTDLSKLLELSEAQALVVNGGNGEAPATPPVVDEDGKCDAESENNFKVIGRQGNATVLVCEVTKVKGNLERVYKWVP